MGVENNFLLAKMSRDTIDNVLILDAKVPRVDGDFRRPVTPATGLYVDIKTPLSALRPGHSSMTPGRCPVPSSPAVPGSDVTAG